MNRRRLLRQWLAGFGVAVTAAAGSAQTARPVPGCPPCPCPTPGMPYPQPGAPTTPGQPPAAPPGSLNTTPLTTPTPEAAGTPGLGEAPSAGTDVSAAISPNMMGDLFGARSLLLTYRVPLTATFPILGPGVTGQGGPGVTVNPNLVTGTLTFGPTPNGTVRTVTAPFVGTDLTYVQPTAAGGVAFDRAAAQAILQTLLSTGQVSAQQVQQLQQLTLADQAKLLQNRGAINQTITQATRGLTVPALTVQSVDGTINGNTITYSALLTGETVVPLPGAGSVVGRVKMSEDNNPLPRDRFIFDYDYFNNVPFTANGIPVNRFQFGIEKTFLDGRASFEVRLPFAGTLDATTVQGFEGTNTELGNLRFALKYLWVRGQTVSVATGAGVTLPTARDTVVYSALDGVTPLYRFENQSVQVEPFAAVLLTPNDRLFGQLWSSVNFDTSGSRLTYNQDVFGGGTGFTSTRVWDLPVLAVDGQLGYWLFRSDYGVVRGLAPFLEMHWNYVIAQDRLIREVSRRTDGQGLTVAAVGGRELNLTAGATTQLGDDLLITVGASAPLLRAPDRTFDAQFGVRLSWFFGRTARDRSVARDISSW